MSIQPTLARSSLLSLSAFANTDLCGNLFLHPLDAFLLTRWAVEVSQIYRKFRSRCLVSRIYLNFGGVNNTTEYGIIFYLTVTDVRKPTLVLVPTI